MMDLEKLKALAEAATPGPWRRWAQDPMVGCVWKDALPEGSIAVESTGTCMALGVVVAGSPTEYDAAFIAAASPDVVLGLIARIEALEAERDASIAGVERGAWRWVT